MNVIFYKGRGAVVPEDQEKMLLDLVKGSKMLPYGMVAGLNILKFSVVYKGLPARKWAAFWIKKGDKRAKSIGTHVHCDPLKKEDRGFSNRESRKGHDRECEANAANLKKKIKMVGGLYNHSLF